MTRTGTRQYTLRYQRFFNDICKKYIDIATATASSTATNSPIPAPVLAPGPKKDNSGLWWSSQDIAPPSSASSNKPISSPNSGSGPSPSPGPSSSPSFQPDASFDLCLDYLAKAVSNKNITPAGLTKHWPVIPSEHNLPEQTAEIQWNLLQLYGTTAHEAQSAPSQPTPSTRLIHAHLPHEPRLLPPVHIITPSTAGKAILTKTSAKRPAPAQDDRNLELKKRSKTETGPASRAFAIAGPSTQRSPTTSVVSTGRALEYGIMIAGSAKQRNLTASGTSSASTPTPRRVLTLRGPEKQKDSMTGAAAATRRVFTSAGPSMHRDLTPSAASAARAAIAANLSADKVPAVAALAPTPSKQPSTSKKADKAPVMSTTATTAKTKNPYAIDGLNLNDDHWSKAARQAITGIAEDEMRFFTLIGFTPRDDTAPLRTRDNPCLKSPTNPIGREHYQCRACGVTLYPYANRVSSVRRHISQSACHFLADPKDKALLNDRDPEVQHFIARAQGRQPSRSSKTGTTAVNPTRIETSDAEEEIELSLSQQNSQQQASSQAASSSAPVPPRSAATAAAASSKALLLPAAPSISASADVASSPADKGLDSAAGAVKGKQDGAIATTRAAGTDWSSADGKTDFTMNTDFTMGCGTQENETGLATEPVRPSPDSPRPSALQVAAYINSMGLQAGHVDSVLWRALWEKVPSAPTADAVHRVFNEVEEDFDPQSDQAGTNAFPSTSTGSSANLSPPRLPSALQVANYFASQELRAQHAQSIAWRVLWNPVPECFSVSALRQLMEPNVKNPIDGIQLPGSKGTGSIRAQSSGQLQLAGCESATQQQQQQQQQQQRSGEANKLPRLPSASAVAGYFALRGLKAQHANSLAWRALWEDIPGAASARAIREVMEADEDLDDGSLLH